MPQRVSAFDLDHTLLTVNSSYLLGSFLYEKKLLSFSKMVYLVGAYCLHKCRLLTINALHKIAFESLFQGKSRSVIDSLLPQFLNRLKNSFNETVVGCLQEAKNKGDYVLILSSAPDFLVEAIANLLGVDAWDGTHYQVDKDQKFCQISRVMQGEDKAEYLKQLTHRMGITSNEITAYSDSYLDLPFMKAAGTPIGVNPDRTLRKMCQLYKWEIL